MPAPRRTQGIVGWVTVAGNQGVTFLLPGGHVYQVVRPCPLTEELKDTDGANTIRMLQELGVWRQLGGTSITERQRRRDTLNEALCLIGGKTSSISVEQRPERVVTRRAPKGN